MDPTDPRHSNSAITLTYMVFRFATVQGQNVDWLLRRNCAVSPKQLAWFYMSMCAVSMVIATAFWFQGATLVMPFAWLELLAVGGCFWFMPGMPQTARRFICATITWWLS